MASTLSYEINVQLSDKGPRSSDVNTGRHESRHFTENLIAALVRRASEQSYTDAIRRSLLSGELSILSNRGKTYVVPTLFGGSSGSC